MLQTLLQKRSNGYYYFRWVCPPAIRKLLGKREIIKSLRTTSKIQALARAGAYYMAVDKLKNDFPTNLDDTNFKIIVSNNWKDPLVVVKDIDISQSERIALDKQMDEIFTTEVHQRFSTLLEFSHLYEAPSYREAVDAESFLTYMIKRFDYPANEKGEFAEGKSIYAITKRIMDLYARIKRIEHIPDVDSLATSEMYELTEILLFRELGRLASTFSASEKWYATYIKDLTSVLYHSNRIKLEKLKSTPPKLPSYLQKPVPAAEAVSSPLFSKIFDEFLAYKIANNNLSNKMSGNYRADFPLFLHFIGNKPIDQIVRRDVKKSLLSCLKFPRRNLRPYRGVPVPELAALEVPESHWLSDRSVLNLQKFLQGIFAYAREQEYIKESPVVNLNLELKLKKNRTNFQVHEVIRLLNVALENKHEWRKWFVLLAAYTGARRGEIAQLRVRDFKIDEASGIKYLLITDEEGDLKTDNALRRVPVHEKLIELGLYEFLSGVGIKLFPEGADNAMTRHFPLIMEAAGVEKTTDLKQNRTLHSLRHSFITQTRGNGHSPDLVQSIVGHEVMSMGVTDGYTGEFSVDMLMPVVSSLKYL